VHKVDYSRQAKAALAGTNIVLAVESFRTPETFLPNRTGGTARAELADENACNDVSAFFAPSENRFRDDAATPI